MFPARAGVIRWMHAATCVCYSFLNMRTPQGCPIPALAFVTEELEQRARGEQQAGLLDPVPQHSRPAQVAQARRPHEVLPISV
jgi:hypothetical protein